MAVTGLLHAADGGSQPPDKDSTQYRLFPHDSLKVTIQGEPDASVERRIDGRGNFNMPYIGDVKISGLTLAEAQDLIAKHYVDADIYIHPEVVVSVVEYVPREISVLGCVMKPGKIAFPPEATNMTIVEAIADAGGFDRLARKSEVHVTRKDDQGADQSFVLDVQKMVEGKGTDNNFTVLPGDTIYVPERLL
jgi:polysaccharide export outer membrane protein